MTLYFSAVVLPDVLNAEIKLFKNLMQQRFGCRVALRSSAHITFIPPFWMDEANENLLMQDLDAVCQPQPTFTVSTRGFSAFSPRTIFIEPVLTAALQHLKQEMDIFCSNHPQYNTKPDRRSFHPHITIATRDLQKKDFAEAWALFSKKEFTTTFEATGLALLRYSNQQWCVIHTSQFLQAPYKKKKTRTVSGPDSFSKWWVRF